MLHQMAQSRVDQANKLIKEYRDKSERRLESNSVEEMNKNNNTSGAE